jgi:glucokinase
MARTVTVADIGGTHARFALARLAPGAPPALSHVTTLATHEHSGLEDAFARFAASLDAPLPGEAALALAAPLPRNGTPVRLTNAPWTIDPQALPDRLGVTRLKLLNDLESLAHAVAIARPADFASICGPRAPLPAQGVISIIAPGTGLGVAMLLRRDGKTHVIPTEAGHIGFSPTDGLEDTLLAAMRRSLSGRVSAERLIGGPGLAAVHLAMGGTPASDEKSLWTEILAADSREAEATLERYLGLLGSFAGDIALAQGASAIVIAGMLGQRLGERLNHPAFARRLLEHAVFIRKHSLSL